MKIAEWTGRVAAGTPGAGRAAGSGRSPAGRRASQPAAGSGMFRLFLKQQGGRDWFRFGREDDGTPSRLWGWDDLD
jgi:hypothetical protein